MASRVHVCALLTSTIRPTFSCRTLLLVIICYLIETIRSLQRAEREKDCLLALLPTQSLKAFVQRLSMDVFFSPFLFSFPFLLACSSIGTRLPLGPSVDYVLLFFFPPTPRAVGRVVRHGRVPTAPQSQTNILSSSLFSLYSSCGQNLTALNREEKRDQFRVFSWERKPPCKETDDLFDCHYPVWRFKKKSERKEEESILCVNAIISHTSRPQSLEKERK